MATAESRLSLVRGRALSARAFERTALVTLGLLWLVVVTGGLVRLTASGLGCPHWPTCEANSLVPSAGYHSVVEFSNRVISGIAMVAALVTAWVGFRVPGLRRSVAWAALAAALGTVAQVPLGAVTVAFDLHPLLVMSHFLLAIAVLSTSAWVGFHAVAFARRGGAGDAAWSRPALLAWAAVAGLSAAGDDGGVRDRRRPSRRRQRPSHRAFRRLLRRRLGARACGHHLLDAVRDPDRGAVAPAARSVVQRLSLAGVVLTLCQLGVGEYQYRNGLPWGVIAVHVAIAATLVITVVTIASMLLYETAADAPGSPTGVEPARPRGKL